jgi:uncharacterized membrane protein
MITNKIGTRQWLLFIFLVSGLTLSLVGLAVWIALSRGEQNQVNPENFQLVFSLSMLGSVIFSVLLAVGVLYIRGKIRR